MRVATGAHDDLGLAAHRLLHAETVERAERRDHLARRRGDGLARRQPQANPPDVALVHDVARDRLEHDGKAEARRGVPGGLGTLRDRLARELDAIGREQSLGLGLRQRPGAEGADGERETGRSLGAGRRRGMQRVVLGDQPDHAQRVLHAVEIELADVAQRLARRGGGGAGRERDHHGLVHGLCGLADQLRACREGRHRGEDRKAVGDVGVGEQGSRGVARDLDLLRLPASAEIDRVVGLGRQQ